MLPFGRLRQNVLKCVPHAQHDYFSSFNQSDHYFLASSLPLPSSLLKLPVFEQRDSNHKPPAFPNHYEVLIFQFSNQIVSIREIETLQCKHDGVTCIKENLSLPVATLANGCPQWRLNKDNDRVKI